MRTEWKDKIYAYWNKTEYGRELIETMTDEALFNLIPNNARKRIGLPKNRNYDKGSRLRGGMSKDGSSILLYYYW